MLIVSEGWHPGKTALTNVMFLSDTQDSLRFLDEQQTWFKKSPKRTQNDKIRSSFFFQELYMLSWFFQILSSSFLFQIFPLWSDSWIISTTRLSLITQFLKLDLFWKNKAPDWRRDKISDKFQFWDWL